MTEITILAAVLLVLLLLYLTVSSMVGSHGDPWAVDLNEPDQDAKFEPAPTVPLLVECDTGGRLLPPDEIMVHSYRWNSAASTYTYEGCAPLSQCAIKHADPALHEVLSLGLTKPATLDCALGASPLPVHGLN